MYRFAQRQTGMTWSEIWEQLTGESSTIQFFFGKSRSWLPSKLLTHLMLFHTYPPPPKKAPLDLFFFGGLHHKFRTCSETVNLKGVVDLKSHARSRILVNWAKTKNPSNVLSCVSFCFLLGFLGTDHQNPHFWELVLKCGDLAGLWCRCFLAHAAPARVFSPQKKPCYNQELTLQCAVSL